MGAHDLDTMHTRDVPPPTAEDRRRAMLTICSLADDIEDARYLIDILALR